MALYLKSIGLVLFTLLTASVADEHPTHLTTRQSSCMTSSDAQVVAENWKKLLTEYSDDVATEALAPDVVMYSSSTNYLISQSCSNGFLGLGEKTFGSRDELMEGQAEQPAIPIEILNLYHGCDSVTARWKSAQYPNEVIGVVTLETKPANSSNQYVITKIFSEFNAGAYLVNLGVYIPTCGVRGQAQRKIWHTMA